MIMRDIVLIGMIITYSYAIYNVCKYYINNDKSISSIIKDQECNSIIFTTMIIMGCLTIIYEFMRNNIVSLILILFLLLGIYGVIIYEHALSIHYIFCFIVFISIICFMYNHCFLQNNIILYLLLYLQEILSACIFLENDIINMEIYLLGNFAVFYIYLHFLQ
jgi:hypothetical protein